MKLNLMTVFQNFENMAEKNKILLIGYDTAFLTYSF